jgi:NAD(P)-dependent dehydrogenase (short-subunit alcohol dehydrogenase family)
MMNSNPIDKNTVMMVSGGGRGITAACVIELAARNQCTFILLGRSSLDCAFPAGYQTGMSEAKLKKLVMDAVIQAGEKPSPKSVDAACRKIKAVAEIQETLRAIESVGGKAIYLSADVTDLNQVKTVMQSEMVKSLGPVSAVLHGAGNLADKLIEQKTLLDFQNVFDPKITGLQNMLQVLKPDRLTTILLFSSVVGFYGNAGQSDYAMANDVLNKLGYFLQASLPHCEVKVLDWGPWQSGMVSPALARAFAKRGIQLIPIQDGAQYLAEQAGRSVNGFPQRIVGSALNRPTVTWEKMPVLSTIQRSMSLAKNPFLLDHQIGGNPVLPATCAEGWMINACEDLYPGYVFRRLESYGILKGIVFENANEQAYQLDITRHESSTSERLRLDVQIFTQAGAELPRYHYKASLFFQPSVEPAMLDLNAYNLQASQTIYPKGHEMYQQGLLFHGPAFQGVREILNLDDTGLLMRCNLSKVPLSVQGQFSARRNNPFMNDVIVQSILVWTQLKLDSPCLPASLEAYDCYDKIQFDRPYYVEMKITQLTQTSILGDLTVFEENGKLLQRLTGLRGTISPQLKRLFSAPERIVLGE